MLQEAVCMFACLSEVLSSLKTCRGVCTAQEAACVRLKVPRLDIGSSCIASRTTHYGSENLSESQVDFLASEKAEEGRCPFRGQVGGVYHSLQRKGTAGLGGFRRGPSVPSNRRNAWGQAVDALQAEGPLLGISAIRVR